MMPKLFLGPKMIPEKRWQGYVLLALAVLIHVFLFSFFGVRGQFVDSQRYIEMAEYVMKHGALESSYQLFYAIPIVLLAFCRLVFDEGLIAFVLLQSILSIAAAFALYRSAWIVFKNPDAGFVATLFFLLWIDCIQWNTAVMTESLASSLTCFIIYLLVVSDGNPKRWTLLSLLLVAMVMTRPTGVLVIVGTVVFLLTRYHRALKGHPVARTLTYLCLVIALGLGAWVMLNAWDFTDQYVKGNIVTYMDVIEGQPLYDASLRLDTTNIRLPDPSKPPASKIIFFMINNPLHFAKAAVLKVFYVVSFYRPYFSTMHNLYTMMWLSTCMCCSFLDFAVFEIRQREILLLPWLCLTVCWWRFLLPIGITVFTCRCSRVLC